MDELIKVDGPVSYPGDCWIWRAYCPYCDRQIPHRGGKGERRHEREMEEARARRPMRAHIRDKHHGGVKHDDRREQRMSTTIEVTLSGQMDLDQAEKAANEILARVKAEREKPKGPQFKEGQVWTALDDRGQRHTFVVVSDKVHRLSSDGEYGWNALRKNGDCSYRHDHYYFTGWRLEIKADGERNFSPVAF